MGFYKKACELGDGPSCAKAASIVLNGSANFTDAQMARGFAERGCTMLKNQDACAALSAALADSGDADGGARLADTSCANGASEGCRLKARKLFYDSSDPGSQAQALPLFTQACNARQAWGCAGLSDAYEKGLAGLPKDRAKAVDYARTGCEQGQGSGREQACTQHGTFLTYGSDKAQINKGEQYLDATCRYGDADACVWLGKLGLRDKPGATTTMAEGLYYERRGCDLNNGGGCAELAFSYEIGNGIDSDSGVAVRLYDKACRLGDAESCAKADELAASGARSAIPPIDPSLTVAEQLVAAEDMVKSGNPLPGVVATYRLTNEDNENAEWLLGGWMYYGLAGVFDPPRPEDGFTLFENAARVGHVQAAIWVGMAYWYGDGVEADQEKGMNYMAIAASRGDESAAAILRSMQAEPIRQDWARRQAEAEAEANRPRSAWEQAMSAWDAALRNGAFSYSSSNYSSMSSGGRSVSDVIDDSNWNHAMDYYSGGTTVCSSSNPYC